ncbi:hypothetical protein [Rhodopseudomonas palustris]|uniref:hypothetical protein n=1 Tax=Rhodopseudomonas palustris TaxID=1076 RepID=UPI0018DC18E9|nr:hypothetical protein [Rhodopseudomonas palustris]
MDHAIRNQLGAIVIPVNRSPGVDPGMRIDLLDPKDRHRRSDTLSRIDLAHSWLAAAMQYNSRRVLPFLTDFIPLKGGEAKAPGPVGSRSDCRTARFPFSFAGNRLLIEP